MDNSDDDEHVNDNDEHKYTTLSKLYGSINKDVKVKLMSILQSPNFQDFTHLISSSNKSTKSVIENTNKGMKNIPKEKTLDTLEDS